MRLWVVWFFCVSCVGGLFIEVGFDLCVGLSMGEVSFGSFFGLWRF